MAVPWVKSEPSGWIISHSALERRWRRACLLGVCAAVLLSTTLSVLLCVLVMETTHRRAPPPSTSAEPPSSAFATEIQQEEAHLSTRSDRRAGRPEDGVQNWLLQLCKQHRVTLSGHGVQTEGPSHKDIECGPFTSGHHEVGGMGRSWSTHTQPAVLRRDRNSINPTTEHK